MSKNVKFSLNNTAREAERLAKSSAVSFAQTKLLKRPLFGDPLKEATTQSENIKISVLGTNVTDWLEIPDQKIINNQGQEVTTDYVIIHSVTFTIDRPKIIVETAITGKEGTIKEFITNGDYSIKVSGALGLVDSSSEASFRDLSDRSYPFKTLEILDNVFSMPSSLRVFSPTLRELGVEFIVIKKHRFLPNTRYKNLVKFELDCVSDQSYDIQHNDKIN